MFPSSNLSTSGLVLPDVLAAWCVLGLDACSLFPPWLPFLCALGWSTSGTILYPALEAPFYPHCHIGLQGIPEGMPVGDERRVTSRWNNLCSVNHAFSWKDFSHFPPASFWDCGCCLFCIISLLMSSFLYLSSSGPSLSHLKCLSIHVTASSPLLILCEPSIYSFRKAIRVFSLKRMIFVSLEVLVQVIQIRFA